MSIFNKIFGGKKEDRTDSKPVTAMKKATLKVNEVTRLTSQAVKVSFEVPEDLKSAFSFKAGQYINLETQIAGKNIRRSYSICSAEQQGQLSVGIKAVEGGVFSNFANDSLKVGDTMTVFCPEGKFVLDHSVNSVVAFAGGSGITPILSHLASIFARNANAEFTLFYSNKSADQVMFKTELEQLSRQYAGLTIHYLYTQSNEGVDKLLNGRLDEEKCEQILQLYPQTRNAEAYLLCGPEGMINTVKLQLVNARIDKEKIRFELFTANAEDATSPLPSNADSKAIAKVKIKCEGEEFEIEMAYSGDTVLEAALDAGADAPYSCRGGVCSTCQAKVIEGEVTMDRNYTLDQAEVEKGFILTCQAHPKSARVVIDYDQLT